jgi:hypothetical protein
MPTKFCSATGNLVKLDTVKIMIYVRGVNKLYGHTYELNQLLLEAILQKVNITGHIGTKSTQIFEYADEVAMSRSKNALEDTFSNTEQEARRRGLLVNENTTKYMQVARAVHNDEPLCCGQHKFKHVKEISYLCSQMNQN